MSSFDPNNPYSATTPSSSVPESMQSNFGKALPTRLNIVAIFLIILSALGLSAIPMAALGLAMQSVVPQPGGGGPNAEAPEVLNQRINELSGKLIIPSITLTVINGVVSGLLLYSGVLVLKRRISGADFGIKACIGGIVLDLIRLVFGIYTSLLQVALLKDLGNMESSGNGPDMQMISSFATIAGFVGMGFVVFYYLLKIAFYAYSISTFKKPEYRSYLG